MSSSAQADLFAWKDVVVRARTYAPEFAAYVALLAIVFWQAVASDALATLQSFGLARDINEGCSGDTIYRCQPSAKRNKTSFT